ncbi:MAGE-like protein 2 [Mesocricetus auratus]|uniref:MAGE-like protein 2 n=1 Tax=Mesocricetus auratus TaxID=10036 RepID=A0A3Q0CFV8_MESAU|nr:MAGE-like protein 2 [Mesocricetus auratus]
MPLRAARSARASSPSPPHTPTPPAARAGLPAPPPGVPGPPRAPARPPPKFPPHFPPGSPSQALPAAPASRLPGSCSRPPPGLCQAASPATLGSLLPHPTRPHYPASPAPPSGLLLSQRLTPLLPRPAEKHPSRHFTYQGVDSGSEIRHQWTGTWVYFLGSTVMPPQPPQQGCLLCRTRSFPCKLRVSRGFGPKAGLWAGQEGNAGSRVETLLWRLGRSDPGAQRAPLADPGCRAPEVRAAGAGSLGATPQGVLPALARANGASEAGVVRVTPGCSPRLPPLARARSLGAACPRS